MNTSSASHGPDEQGRTEFDRRIEDSFERLAAGSPQPGTSLTQGAIAQAGTIRRRRTAMAVSGVAAALAIAVPVGMNLMPGSTKDPLPADRGTSSVTVTEEPTQTEPAPPPTVGPTPTPTPSPATTGPTAAGESTGTSEPAASTQRVDLTVSLGSVTTAQQVAPYIVNGTYHGASGTVVLPTKQGIDDALLINKNTSLLIHVVTAGQAPRLQIIRLSDGTQVGADLQDMGAPVTNRDGSMFAATNGAGLTRVYRADGSELASVQGGADAGDLSESSRPIGFLGNQVLIANSSTEVNKGVSVLDLASGGRTTYSSDMAYDVLDSTGEVLLAKGDASNVASSVTGLPLVCWAVRPADDTKAPAAGDRDCSDRIELARLSPDGSHMLASDTVGETTSWQAATTSGTLQILSLYGENDSISVPALEYVPSAKKFVAVVTDTGSRKASLNACTLERCEPIAPVVDAQPGNSPVPYVLVRH